MLEKMRINFDYPKAIKLIQYLLSFFVQKGYIVLDLFSSFGTTEHATLQISKNTLLNYILVEMENYADSTTAARVKKPFPDLKIIVHWR